MPLHKLTLFGLAVLPLVVDALAAHGSITTAIVLSHPVSKTIFTVAKKG